MAKAYIVEQELYGTWRRRDRLASTLYRGDDADDNPGQPTEYVIKGRVSPTGSYVVLDGASAVQDDEAWVGLDNLAYKPDWVQSVDLDNGDQLAITDTNQEGLGLVGPLTLEAWVRFDSVPGGAETWLIAGKWEAGGDQQYSLSAFASGGTPAIQFSINAFDTYVHTGNIGLLTGVWYHVVGVYDPSLADPNKVKLYVDAVDESNSTSGSDTSIAAGTDDFAIGGAADGSVGFQGRIQDVRLWNVAKSSTAISNNRYMWQRPSEVANLVGWWPLNGNATDSSGTGNDLANTGTPTYTTGVPGLSPDGHVMALTEFVTKTSWAAALQYPEILMRLGHFRQIIRNPSFERDNETWTTLTGTPGFNAVGAFGGRSFGGNGNGSGNSQENEQDISVTPLSLSSLSTRYARTTFLRRKATAGTTDTVRVRVRTYNSTPTLLDTYDSTATVPASDTSWERVVNMMTIGSTTDSVKVTNHLVEISGGGGLEPNVYLDSLDVRVGDIYDAFNGGPAAACLSNPNFNTNLTSWTTSGTWARATTNLHEGAGNAQCSADGELSQVGTLPSAYDDEGDWVWVSCARRDSASTEKMNVRVEILDSADAVLASAETTSVTVFTSGANPWKRRDLYVMIPSPTKLGGSGTVKVKLRFIGDVGAGADTRVDDIQCVVFKGRP